MKLIKIGNRLLNPDAIIEVVDQGVNDVDHDKKRTVLIRMSDGNDLLLAGAEAEAVWAKAQAHHELELWAETYTPAKLAAKFH